MNTKKLYWSPAFRWEIDGSNLKIEMFNYGEQFTQLFPDFYFLLQKGIKEEDLIDNLEGRGIPGTKNFIKDLIKRQILVSSPLEIQQLVYLQNHLFNNKYGEEVKYNAKVLLDFKNSQLNRNPVDNKDVLDEIRIPDYNFSSIIEERKSTRNFNKEKVVTQEQFFKIISILRQRPERENRYYYASAGGLYPIDVYLYVKPNKIDNIPGGLYYFSPNINVLQKISDKCEINADSQYFINKEIFLGSAFSMYFVYDANVTMPKYGGMAYIYSCIDTGIMVSSLTYASESVGVGSCSIGEMDYKKIKKYFPLSLTMSFLHSMEFGLKNE